MKPHSLRIVGPASCLMSFDFFFGVWLLKHGEVYQFIMDSSIIVYICTYTHIYVYPKRWKMHDSGLWVKYRDATNNRSPPNYVTNRFLDVLIYHIICCSLFFFVAKEYIYLEPVRPLFWWLKPPKQCLFQAKQGSFGFHVYVYIYINGTPNNTHTQLLH